MAPAVAIPLSDEAKEALAAARHEADKAASDLAELRTHYTDAHPDVAAAQRRNEQARVALAEVKRRVASLAPPVVEEIPEEDPRVRSKLSTELRALDDSLLKARKRKSGSAAESERDGVVNLETQWVALNRAVAEARERQEQLERRHFQAAIVARVEGEGAQNVMTIVDEAYLPAVPSARARGRVAAAALAIAVLVALVGAVSLGVRDDRLVDDVELREIAADVPVVRIRLEPGRLT